MILGFGLCRAFWINFLFLYDTLLKYFSGERSKTAASPISHPQIVTHFLMEVIWGYEKDRSAEMCCPNITVEKNIGLFLRPYYFHFYTSMLHLKLTLNFNRLITSTEINAQVLLFFWCIEHIIICRCRHWAV